MEEQATVDAFVRALFRHDRPGIDKAERPTLKLEWIFLRELLRIGDRCGLADDLVGFLDLRTKGADEADLDEIDGKVRDVDANPAALEPFRYCDGGSAPAEGIENDIAFVAGCFDDAF